MMESPLPASAVRVAEAAAAAGLDAHIVEMAETTRTAEEAARACGCAPAQIVKSLIFRGRTSAKPYLLLVSGRNRVDETKVAGIVGESLTRPDADYVRGLTGFAIGGVPPLGHATPLQTFIDTDLLAFAEVWAAAGTPRCVMKLDPNSLKAATGAIEISVR
jgi:prolyl-tRNA editing enzyme YbaK/EbsC (Cys-tRNA(Pro) deacylase)